MRTRPTVAALLVALTIQSCSSGPAAGEIARHITTLSASPRVGGQRLVERGAVSQFYKARGFRPAWLDRSAEIVESIRGVAADGLDPADYHLEAIESLLEKRRGGERTAEGEAVLDVLLADAVAAIADDVRYGKVRPAQVNPGWTADPRENAPALDSTLAAIATGGSVRTALARQRPDHFIYRGLVSALESLREIESRGGWPAVPAIRRLAPGAVDRRVPAVRRRLRASAELDGAAPSDSARYDPALARAVEDFQVRHRLSGGGVIDAATVAAMNVSVGTRIAQVRANLERARWVLDGLGESFLLVNLPAFKAYLIRDHRNVWESRTQIGEEAMQTPTFRAGIRTVVFNPDWTVPPSILENEILAEMKAGKDPIGRQGLVIYDHENNVVDPRSIDWRSATPASFPYSIRQPPSDDNALGKIKFLFPNKYSIYLHDTPNRHLFEADRRTFSHGCIRLERPVELAELLLQGHGDWGPGAIQEAIASGKTRNVTLDPPLPIVIVYWTVSVGASGEVRYAHDIYGLDGPLAKALDTPSRG